MDNTIAKSGLEAGQLRERLYFYELVKTSDGAGGTTAVKQLAFSRLASMRPTKSNFTINGIQPEIFNGFECLVRVVSSTPIRNTHIIRYKGLDYRIIGNRLSDIYDRYIHLIITREV